MTNNQKSIRELYLSHIIYGAFKGIVTSLAVIASAHGAKLSPDAIIIIGLAALVTNGFISSAGTYLSTQTNIQQSGVHSTDETIAAMITFMVILISGLIPLSGFILERFLDVQSGIAYTISAILAFFTLFIMGALKAKQLCQSPIYDGTKTLIFGIIATTVSYMIGHLFGQRQ